MNEQIKKLLNKAENLGWNVQKEDGNVYMFSRYSPVGQDFSVIIDTENNPHLFVANIYDVYSNFDVSEETYLWLDESGHGKNGALYDMKDLYEDIEKCQEMILELHDELSVIW
ncbi:MAG TPA: hypothetical protein GX695_05090 [Acholeplasmataceae bacterium]|nr:hypothetical protein [Acholeplasmataceae bacterium]